MYVASYEERLKKKMSSLRWENLHIDPILFLLLLSLVFVGLVILYSATDQSLGEVSKQALRFGLGFFIMLLLAQISPKTYQAITPTLFGITVFLLIMVLLIGHSGHGAQRWLNLGLFHFQPSELAKLTVPMMIAWFMHEKVLPPSFKNIAIALILLIIPVLLTAKQPDLGTAIVIMLSGVFVIILGGISWKLIISAGLSMAAAIPVLWHFLHPYQKQRILTFLNPERDPLGAGYHIIQSKIAIGSGGFAGKGYLMGTQSHLQFLPTHTTDFIFSVAAEEWGFVGSFLLIVLFTAIFARCLYICFEGQNTFARLWIGSLSLTFFVSMFINIGMVSGILPVVGIPLPMISYGGTSLVSLLASFGIIMSIHTHKRLLSS
ncbi:MAG TPA: rod shape-determining protein RodA [Coxiellaceae bacterium]|nr:rod shape-determining protein RodA [Coxiellaceae bacterium]